MITDCAPVGFIANSHQEEANGVIIFERKGIFSVKNVNLIRTALLSLICLGNGHKIGFSLFVELIYGLLYRQKVTFPPIHHKEVRGLDPGPLSRAQRRGGFLSYSSFMNGYS